MAILFEEIPGLYLIPNVFSQEDNNMYMQILEEENNNPNVSNQIHTATEYGWKFLPATIKQPKDYLGDYPEWLEKMWQKIFIHVKANIPNFPEKSYPDNVLINTYDNGDGCKSHIDQLNFWDNWVVGASFGSGCTFEFTNDFGNEAIEFWMPPKSIYVMIDDARYKWKHGIKYSPIDLYYGDVIPRTKRISLTFRTMLDNILNDKIKNQKKI